LRYSHPAAMAGPRIGGLDVSPVTASSRTYRASAPVPSMTRLMLSSHRLWPNACSRCAGLSSAPMCAPVRAVGPGAVDQDDVRPAIHLVTPFLAGTVVVSPMLAR